MRKSLSVFVMMLLATAAVADDWPQWLGARRDGSTTEKIAEWKEPLKVLWKKPLGEGHSGPVVAKGKVVLHTRIADKTEEQLTAFDASTGEVLWQSAPYDRGKFNDPFKFGSGPRATPAIVDGKVYAYGINGMLSCVDAETGKVAWEVDALKKYKTGNLFFGASSSPLVTDDLVLINVGGKGHSIVAFDRQKGGEKWTALDDSASYSSGIVTGKDKERQLVFLTGKRLVGLAPADGRLLWDFPYVDKLSESSTTPVVAGDILFGSSVTLGGVALKFEKSDNGPKVKKLWEDAKYNCYFSTPVAVGDQLYVVTASMLSKKATLRCIDIATGKQLWTRENVGEYHASLLRTGDGKLLMLEEKGDLVLLQPDAKQYRELCRSTICTKTWAHPAIADGRLYVRDGGELICVELPK